MVDGAVEFVLDETAWRSVMEADDDDGNEGEEEARYYFIQSKPGKLFPYQDGQATDDDAGKSAVLRHPLPEQG